MKNIKMLTTSLEIFFLFGEQFASIYSCPKQKNLKKSHSFYTLPHLQSKPFLELVGNNCAYVINYTNASIRNGCQSFFYKKILGQINEFAQTRMWRKVF